QGIPCWSGRRRRSPPGRRSRSGRPCDRCAERARMFISEFAIRRPIVTIVTMIALVAFGLYALLQLETDEFPELNAPVVVVTVPYPGADPTVVEREVVDPAEEAIRGLDGIDEVRSSATDGLAVITAIFVFGRG